MLFDQLSDQLCMTLLAIRRQVPGPLVKALIHGNEVGARALDPTQVVLLDSGSQMQQHGSDRNGPSIDARSDDLLELFPPIGKTREHRRDEDA